MQSNQLYYIIRPLLALREELILLACGDAFDPGRRHIAIVVALPLVKTAALQHNCYFSSGVTHRMHHVKLLLDLLMPF
jgi:hypothetical protein